MQSCWSQINMLPSLQACHVIVNFLNIYFAKLAKLVVLWLVTSAQTILQICETFWNLSLFIYLFIYFLR